MFLHLSVILFTGGGARAWQEGACMAGGVRRRGGGEGHAWQERRPLQRAARILLEYILVSYLNACGEVQFLWI